MKKMKQMREKGKKEDNRVKKRRRKSNEKNRTEMVKVNRKCKSVTIEDIGGSVEDMISVRT